MAIAGWISTWKFHDIFLWLHSNRELKFAVYQYVYGIDALIRPFFLP